MKKQAITIVVLTVVMGGLIAALLILRAQPPVEAPTLSMIGNEEVLSFESPVSSVTVTNTGGAVSYTVKRNTADGGPGSTLVGFEDLPVDVAKTNALLTAAQSLESTRLVQESAEDYAPFGLSPAVATVEIADENGVSATLLIGNSAPDGNSRYVQVQGETAIYLVSSYRLTNYLSAQTSYMSITVTPGSATQYAAEKATLGGTVREESGEITVVPAPEDKSAMETYTHVLTTPVSFALDTQAGLTVLQTLFGIQAAEVLAIKPDSALLSEKGLDTPYATAVVESAEYGTFTLSASEPDEMGMVNLIREGVPLLYRVDASSLLWLGTQYHEVMRRTVSGLFLDDVAEIEVRSDTESYLFKIEHEPDGSLGLYCDGREVDRNSFMAFCEVLRNIRYEEYTTDTPAEDARVAYQVTYRYVDGSPDKVISFYPGAIRKYFVDAGDIDVHFYATSLYLDKVMMSAAAAAAAAAA